MTTHRHSGAHQHARAARGPVGANPESRAMTSGFRVRTRNRRVRPGMTALAVSLIVSISPAQAQSKRRESAKNNLFSNFKS